MDQSGTDKAECSRKLVNGGRVAGVIKSLINARNLQLECATVLHDSLLVPVFKYDNETMIWREKERSWIRGIQMDNLRGLLGIRRDKDIFNFKDAFKCYEYLSVNLSKIRMKYYLLSMFIST